MSSSMQIAYFFAASGICWSFGLLIQRLISLHKNKFEQESVFILPAILGAAGIICISASLNYLGLPMRTVSLSIFGITVLGIWWIRHELTRVRKISRAEFYAAICMVVTGLAVMASYLIFNSFNPYNDTFTYICIADYLLDHGFLKPLDTAWGNQAVVSQVDLYQTYGFRMGAQFILSFFTALFNCHFSIEAYLPVVAFFAAFFTGSIWCFCRIGLALSAQTAFLATLFTSIHWAFPINAAANGFFPQTLGLAFFILTLTLILRFPCEDNSGSFLGGITLTAGVLMAGVILTYSEAFPFLILCCCCLLLYFKKKYGLKYGHLFSLFFTIIMIGLVLANYGFWQAGKAIIVQFGAVVGWDVHYTAWQYWTQFLSIAPGHFGQLSASIYRQPYYMLMNLAGISAFIIAIRGFVRIGYEQYELQQERLALNTIAIVSIPFVLALVYFSLGAANPWQAGTVGQSWSTYKVCQYVFFLFPPAIAIVWRAAYNSGRCWKLASAGSGVLILFLMIGVLAGAIYNLHGPMRAFSDGNSNPLGAYYLMRGNIKALGIQSFNVIMNTDLKHRQIVAYFLREYDLNADWSNDDYIHIPAERKRQPQKSLNSIVYYKEKSFTEGKMLGAGMMLIEPNSRGIMWRFRNGWYEQEKDESGNWWIWAEKNARIVLSLEKSQKIKLAFDCLIAGESQGGVELIVGSIVEQKPLKIQTGQWSHQTIELTAAQDGEISFFKPTGGIKLPNDSRLLGFAIKNLTVEY